MSAQSGKLSFWHQEELVAVFLLTRGLCQRSCNINPLRSLKIYPLKGVNT